MPREARRIMASDERTVSASLSMMEDIIMKMTKTIGTAVALAAVVVLAAWAGEASAIRATVPFEFTVADQKLPAGEYQIVKSGAFAAIQVQSRQNRTTILVGSAAGNTNKTGHAAALAFNKYGNQYFLSEVWMGNGPDGVQLSKSKAEKKLAERPESYNIAASRVR
jgi:hypothetical protein